MKQEKAVAVSGNQGKCQLFYLTGTRVHVLGHTGAVGNIEMHIQSVRNALH